MAGEHGDCCGHEASSTPGAQWRCWLHVWPRVPWGCMRAPCLAVLRRARCTVLTLAALLASTFLYLPPGEHE